LSDEVKDRLIAEHGISVDSIASDSNRAMPFQSASDFFSFVVSNLVRENRLKNVLSSKVEFNQLKSGGALSGVLTDEVNAAVSKIVRLMRSFDDRTLQQYSSVIAERSGRFKSEENKISDLSEEDDNIDNDEFSEQELEDYRIARAGAEEFLSNLDGVVYLDKGDSIFEEDEGLETTEENKTATTKEETTTKEDSAISKEKQDSAKKVYDRILEILQELGVGVGTLEEWEQRNGKANVTGVIDPNSTKRTAEGLLEIIRIAKGEKGRQALPEEFAHLVDMILEGKSHPLYNRLVSLLNSNEELVKNILGDNYETYNKLYNGDKMQLAREARGQLISKHLLNGNNINEAPTQTQSLLGRIKEWFKRLFGKVSTSSLERQMAELNDMANKFSLQLLNGEVTLEFTLNQLQGKRAMYQATESYNKALKILENIRSAELKKEKIAQATGTANAVVTAARRIRVQSIKRVVQNYEKTGNDIGINEVLLNAVKQSISDMNDIIVKLDALQDSLSNDNEQGKKSLELMNEVAGVLREMKS
jgi:hypothetical protein